MRPTTVYKPNNYNYQRQTPYYQSMLNQQNSQVDRTEKLEDTFNQFIHISMNYQKNNEATIKGL